MMELLGLIFGGASRLVQHWMDQREKQAERAHEAVMYDKQIALMDKRHAHDAELRRMDGENAQALADIEALARAAEAQAREATAAGGWVAKFSAVMRPLLTFYHAVVIYTAVKAAQFYLAGQTGYGWAEALTGIYGEFDRAMLGSMIGFWFQDRSLRRGGR